MEQSSGSVSFDEIEVGSDHRAGPFVVTAEGIGEFSTKWDPWDYHLDPKKIDASLFEGLAASGVHTLCIANLLLHQAGQAGSWNIRALLGAEYRFPNPTRAGDELWISRTVTDKRMSRSRPEFGVVQCEDRLVNQDDVVVLEQKQSLLVARSPGATAQRDS
ncbi:MAG: MaoC/PaaZ C-terminal domain-containing protein [Acidimicrobiia bacterium]|nr:MaoC/PaaZ C-terminal domain-containing protein [Acidimicrobiia bacterium]